MPICSCPGATALPTIPSMVCDENFGQIQKLAFQRLKGADGEVNKMTETNIKLLATWQTAIAATTDAKIAVTPIVENPTSAGGDEITYGGGNETAGGVEKTIGSNPTTLTFTLNGFPQSTIKEIKKLMCEKNLGVFLFSGDGKVGCIKSGSADCTPIPVRKLFVGDKMFGGLQAPDTNTLEIAFNPNFSDDFGEVALSFDPIIEL